MTRRLLPVMALAVLASSAARAEPRPSLDDFYDRTRSRAEGFDECLGYCDGERLAAFLIGAQAADPSTDAVQRAPAYGGRLGLDLGTFDGRYDIARTKAWVDFLEVAASGDSITDLSWQTTLFKVWGEPFQPGMQLSLDTLLAQRTELEPSDFAEFQLVPYRLGDAEVEVAATGEKLDKDTFWALPVGVQSRTRWDLDGAVMEQRHALSVAVAARGFSAGMNRLRHHYQFDFLRVKRSDWQTPAGEASAWTLSAGYQRLSPDVEWLEIWLLAGYEWARGTNRDHGLVLQLGAETHFEGDAGRVELGPKLESHLVLDRRANEFQRVQHASLYYRHSRGVLRWGLAYEGVRLADIATLHALTPEAGVRLFGLELLARYRFAFARDDRVNGTPQDRFNVSADWIF